MEAIALMHLYVSKQPPNFRTYFSLSRERHTFRNTLTAAVVALTALLLSGDLLHLLGNWKLWGLHVIFFYSEKKKSREFFLSTHPLFLTLFFFFFFWETRLEARAGGFGCRVREWRELVWLILRFVK